MASVAIPFAGVFYVDADGAVFHRGCKKKFPATSRGLYGLMALRSDS
jgi:hypothetical protein